MKRIDEIIQLENKCTGCMACVDACPANCVSAKKKEDGFLYTYINEKACIKCGKCYAVCPIETQQKHENEQHLYASYAINEDIRNRGSSGGIFEVLATQFLEKGFYVCGAAFDGTRLKHKLIKEIEELPILLKSKYLQSNTKGIYGQVVEVLKNGEKVFFCGTPCQVSALVNSVPSSLRERLITADIICHGVPSQMVFDKYIQTLESECDGKIKKFSFRVKDNRYRHAHGFMYEVEKNGKIKKVDGVYTQSSFYNAFKNYLIFRESCYDCKYSTLKRVSDITLADFWGIEKYDFEGNTDAGVSMVITNTKKGQLAYEQIATLIVSKEFPVEYGVESNHCLTHSTSKPQSRDKIISELQEKPYQEVASRYFKESIIYKVYWMIPAKIRNMYRKLRG